MIEPGEVEGLIEQHKGMMRLSALLRSYRLIEAEVARRSGGMTWLKAARENTSVHLVQPEGLDKHYVCLLRAQPEGGYSVEFQDLPGCVTEGDSLEEALDNAREALTVWLTSQAELRAALYAGTSRVGA